MTFYRSVESLCLSSIITERRNVLCTACVHFGFKTGPLIMTGITIDHTLIGKYSLCTPNSQHMTDFLIRMLNIFENSPIFHFALMDIGFYFRFFLLFQNWKIQWTEGTRTVTWTMFTYVWKLSTHVLHPMRVPPEPAEHVASVAAVSTVVTPGEPVVELGKFVLPCQVHLLIWLPCSCQKKTYP